MKSSVSKAIVREVKRNPGNLSAAFKAVATSHGIAWRTASNHWYNTLRGKKAVFNTTSSSKSLTNRKNVTVRKNQSISVTDGSIALKNGLVIKGNFTIQL